MRKFIATVLAMLVGAIFGFENGILDLEKGI